MAELIRDRDEKNQIRWKVVSKSGKVIIITTSEDVADTYYQNELEREQLASVYSTAERSQERAVRAQQGEKNESVSKIKNVGY